MRRAPILPFVLAVAMGAGPAAAQTARGGLGIVPGIEYYRFGDPAVVGIESLSLMTVPITARIALGPTVSLEVNGAFARGVLTRRNGSSITVSGPTDTELRLTARLARDAVTVTAIALAPTGKGELTTEEADAAGAFAADVLPFRITNWGSGGGVGAAVSFARQMGTVGAGLSAGYVVAREFDPLTDQSFSYRPGNQLHLTGALTSVVGAAARASLNVSWQHFAVDEANGQNLYQAGDRLQARGSVAFASGERASGIVYLGLLRRARGEYSSSFDVIPARNLVFTGAAFRTPAGRLVLTPGVDLRVQTRAEGTFGGFVATGGLGAEAPLGSAVLLPSLRVRYGSVKDSEGASSSLTGIELGLGIRFGGAG
ncbi:MAG: hypothetical protein PVH00_00345 [Gemmatimonadota bacterium]|jgi:hypothetical protein